MMKIVTHRITRASLVLMLSILFAGPSVAETREEELRNKEAQLEKQAAELQRQRMELEVAKKAALLEKTAAELDRQRVELEAAKKQLRFEENDQRATLRLEGDVLFDSGKAILRPEAQQALEKAVVILAQYPRGVVVIEGHTDSVGKRAANLKLSTNRARAVEAFLKKRTELPGLTWSATGWGDMKPLVPNGAEEGRQRNRRVDIVIEKPN